MTPRQLFSVIYTLMAEEVGGVGELENQFSKWEEEQNLLEYAKSEARKAPDRKVPEKVAEQMREVMKFAAPAPLKKKVND